MTFAEEPAFEAGEKCKVPIKQLLSHLARSELFSPLLKQLKAENLPGPKREVALYRLFLSHNLHFGTSLTTISGLDHSELEDFYGEDSDQEPYFLTFDNRSSDLTRLCEVFQIAVVIFFYGSPESERQGDALKAFKYFDNRFMSRFSGASSEPKSCFYFQLSHGRGSEPAQLEPISTEEELHSRYVFPWSEQRFARGKIYRARDYSGCFLRMLFTMLNLPMEEIETVDTRCPTVEYLCQTLISEPFWRRVLRGEGGEVFETLRLQRRRYVLSYHAGTRFVKRRFSNPTSQLFRVLCIFPPPQWYTWSLRRCTSEAGDANSEEKELNDDGEKANLKSLCLTYPDGLYEPTDCVDQQILRENQKNKPSKAPRIRDLIKETKRADARASRSAGAADANPEGDKKGEEASGAAGEEEGEGEEMIEAPSSSPCSCELCLDSRKYEKNFNQKNPAQKVMVCLWASSFLLVLLFVYISLFIRLPFYSAASTHAN